MMTLRSHCHRPYAGIIPAIFLFFIPASVFLPAQVKTQEAVRLVGTTHRLANPASDRGRVPDESPVDRVLLVMKRSPQRQADLATFLTRLQNPASSDYHRWLKPEEFGQRFGASEQDIATATSWLSSRGLRVNRVAKGRGLIEFSGQAGSVGQAFHTEIHKFSVAGHEYWANATDISVPQTVASIIEGVALLNNFKDYSSGAVLQPEPEGKTIKGDKPLFVGSSGRHYLAPSDFAAIYNVPAAYTGSGVTIAVVGDGDFDTDDVDDFRSRFDLPQNTPTKIFDGITPGTGGAGGEALLDVTWSGAVAKDAAIAYVGATSIFLSEAYIVDNNLADIVTESFSACEAIFAGDPSSLSFVNDTRSQAAAQGISWVVAAGDSGPYQCENFHAELSYSQAPTLSVNALAAAPSVVAVGGTEFLDSANLALYWNREGYAFSYIPEGAWNQSCAFNAPCFTSVVAGGGGQSTQPGGKPSWQAAVGVGPGRANDNTRDLPDVALSASWQIDPYVICNNRSCMGTSDSFHFYATGGTSAAAPSFAGILALVAQKTGGRLGAVNPVLYQLASSQFAQCLGVASPTSACAFNDITAGTTATPGAPNPDFAATPGYDMATGLGSVNVTNLVNLWTSGNPTKTTTQLSLSPATMVHGAAAQVMVSVVPQNGTGVPSGPVTLLAGASQLICPGTAATRTAPDACVSVQIPALTSGVSQSAIQGLPGGSYTVTAAYGGDGTFAPSVSAPTALVVSPEPSTVSVTVKASQLSVTYGTTVDLAANVMGTSTSGIPTGTVKFYDNGALLGPGAPNTIGTATFPVNTFAPGSHFITAAYSGDRSFTSSGSTAGVTVQIQKAITSLTIANACSAVGGVVKPIVAYAGGGAVPSGSVVYSLAGTILASVPLDATGAAQFTVPASVTTLPAAIQASYSGNANYTASATLTINVGLTDCAAVMVDSATSTHVAALGGLATIYGQAMSSETVAAPTASWTTSLGGATVSITDSNNQTVLAQLAYVSPGQINLCVPSSLAAGQVTVQVGGSATSNPFQATIEASSPVIFAAQTISVSSSGTVSPTVPLGPITIPAGGTVYLIVYATGVRNHSATSVVDVLIGDSLVGTYPVEPAYAGAEGIFPGLDQINLQIPAKLAGSGSATVYVTINDKSNGDILQESNALALSFPSQ